MTFIACSGTVVEQGTGKPIAGAVILRSWKRYWFNPIHRVSNLVAFEETQTNNDGRFFLLGLKRALSVSIPLLGPIEASEATVFKPGYRPAWFTDPSDVLALEKVSETYVARLETFDTVRLTGSMEIDDLPLWKAALIQEEAALRTLPRRAPGVFYHGNEQDQSALRQPHDLAVDDSGKVFVADSCTSPPLWKFTAEGKVLHKPRFFKSSHCELYQLAWTPQHELLAFGQGMLSTVNPQTVNLQLPMPQQAPSAKPSLAIPV